MLGAFLSLTKYQLIDVLRAKWLMAYALIFFALGNGFLFFGDDSSKAVASILSVVLFIVPMISILYAAIHWYNSASFTYLLLTQPLRRSFVFLSHWLAVSAGLSCSFLLSTLAAFALYRALDLNALTVLFCGTALTFIFVGLGLLVAILVSDPMKGVGAVFLLWLYSAILHDVFVFAVVSLLRDYPVEIPAMVLMAINPIDLTRVLALLLLDLSAMMGYTGRILQEFLSEPLGRAAVVLIQLLWISLPVWLGLRAFSHKDLSV
jgi:Cu-processing system permease protein